MKSAQALNLAVIVALVSATSPAAAQQVADSSFDTSVARPAFTERHPVVVIDAAHRNFHTMDGRYQPFAALLRADGLRVQSGAAPFTAASLAGVDVLVIANALGAGASALTDDSPPAFTDAESDAVRDWVRGGGALLLIADHAPFGTAARALASRFGITFGEGFVLDSAHSLIAGLARGQARPPGAGTLLDFTRDAGLLGAHSILEGRDSTERINRVLTFTGQSMTLPSGATPLLILSPTAREARTRADLQRGRTESQRGSVQGLAMTFGRGRVVALGEAAMMSAQLAGPANGPQPRFQMGMNHPGNDDKQFALNAVRWLALAEGLSGTRDD